MKGLYAPLITPFSDEEDLDLEGLRKNLEFYERQPLDGYLINGSSAEADMLNFSEQLQLLRTARAASNRTVIAGLAASSTRVALEKLEKLAEAEPDAVLVRTPSYFGAQFDQRLFFETETVILAKNKASAVV